MHTPLRQTFFARSTITVARDLVGCGLLVTAAAGREVSGRIVEAEAYGGENDPASHAGRGRTPRSEIMFGPPGYAYVYLIYGMHYCLNFVAETDGEAGAVLIRALEPALGGELMAERRGFGPGKASERDLCTGPGRLCQALGNELRWNGLPLVPGLPGPDSSAPGQIRLVDGKGPPGGAVATPRIGIRQAADRPNRFIDPRSACLSG